MSDQVTNPKTGSMLGRLGDASQRDGGTLVHIIVEKLVPRPPCSYSDWGRSTNEAKKTMLADVALCGKRPGRRSVGWEYDTGAPTCSTCLRLAERQTR